MEDNPSPLPTRMYTQYKKIQKKHGLLPIKVTPFYLKKITEEVNALGHRNGPLSRMIFPNMDKINLHVWNEHKDRVDDRKNMIKGLEGIAVRKYDERILLLVTDSCFSNCQYCFRQDILAHDVVRWFSEKTLSTLIGYINNNETISEIIFSWWDPMSLGVDALDQILTKIQNNTKIKNFRIHTRSIIYSPEIFTPKTIIVLAKYNVRLVFHISHPYEICEIVRKKILSLSKAWIRLYNQFPLLRGINDHYLVLIKHLELLDELGIRNLSVFIPDPVKFSASYRIPLKRIKETIKQVNRNSPSRINSTRFLMDSNIWKLRMEDMVSYDKTNLVGTFMRGWLEMKYNDFPEKLDIPGDIETLLWKRSLH